MSDANFINAYNEIVLDNLISILKQNFMFQTQIKFLEKRVSAIPELEEKNKLYNLVVEEKINLENKVVSLQSELENKNTIIKNTSNNDNEKNRIQIALNTQAKELSILNEKFNCLECEYNNQKKYIEQLEEMLPNTKRKKLNLKPIETPKEEVEIKTESSGGTF
jgi:hypothetical protein